jgi:hypothetical protein
MKNEDTNEYNVPERDGTPTIGSTNFYASKRSVSIPYKHDPDFKPQLHRPVPIPLGAPADSQEREMIRRLMNGDCLLSGATLTEIVARLPRGLEISPSGMQFLRSLSLKQWDAFARAKQDLSLMDYVQAPPSIGQFLSDPYYLGGSLVGVAGAPGLWPTWRDLLIRQFDLDSFIHNLVITGAIGVGKTLALVALILFRICVCLHLRDPFGYFELARTSVIVFLLLSISKDTLRATAWSRAIRLMASSPFFREKCGCDSDRSYASMEIPLCFLAPELSSFHVTLSGGSQRQHRIGRDVLVVGMDESNSRLEADPPDCSLRAVQRHARSDGQLL